MSLIHIPLYFRDEDEDVKHQIEVVCYGMHTTKFYSILCGGRKAT